MRAAILSLILAEIPGTAAGWLQVRTPQIEILTDAGEKPARAILDRLDQVRRVFSTRGAGPLPLQVFLFSSESEFRTYADGPLSAGFYQSGLERDYIVLHTSTGLNRAVAHEYVHLVLDRGTVPLPPWFEEGTAELY